MTIKKTSILTVVAISTFFSCGAISQANSRHPDYFETPKAMLLLLPPTVVATGELERQAWSPDGAYAAVVVRNKTKSWVESTLSPQVDQRHVPQPPVELYIWDRLHGEAKRMWSTDDPKVKVDDLIWIHGTSELLVSASAVRLAPATTAVRADGVADQAHYETGVLAINATNGQFHWIPSIDNAEGVHLEASPTKPIVELMTAAEGTDPKSIVGNQYTIDANGYVTHRRPILSPSMYWPSTWSADGSTLLFLDLRKKVTMRLQEDGTLAKTTEPLYAPIEKNPEIVMTAKPSLARVRSASKSLNTLWLSSAIPTSHPDAFVSADGKAASLSPSLDAIFYIEGGIAKVRTWVPLSDDQKRALTEALKQDALSSAKQVALGLIMFSADNDDVLPGAGGLDGIAPYLGDSSLMDGFNYTPPSNLNTTSWTSPAETVIGTMPGPGGNAVAYGDGHVVWRPNP